MCGLLQLGNGFNLPPTKLGTTLVEYIKSFENNIKHLNDDERVKMRTRAAHILRDTRRVIPALRNKYQMFFKSLSSARSFMKLNPTILFTRADKGNVTVAIDIDSYMDKMLQHFNDRTTYQIVDHDPTRKLITDLRTILCKWKRTRTLMT